MTEKELELAFPYSFDSYNLDMDAASLNLFMKKYKEKMELRFSGDAKRKDDLYKLFHSDCDKSPVVYFLLDKILELKKEIKIKDGKIKDGNVYSEENKRLKNKLLEYFISSRGEDRNNDRVQQGNYHLMLEIKDKVELLAYAADWNNQVDAKLHLDAIKFLVLHAIKNNNLIDLSEVCGSQYGRYGINRPLDRYPKDVAILLEKLKKLDVEEARAKLDDFNYVCKHFVVDEKEFDDRYQLLIDHINVLFEKTNLPNQFDSLISLVDEYYVFVKDIYVALDGFRETIEGFILNPNKTLYVDFLEENGIQNEDVFNISEEYLIGYVVDKLINSLDVICIDGENMYESIKDEVHASLNYIEIECDDSDDVRTIMSEIEAVVINYAYSIHSYAFDVKNKFMGKFYRDEELGFWLISNDAPPM